MSGDGLRRFAVALGGGFLVALSLPPWGWWPLAFAGIAVFDAAASAAPTRRGRFGAGFAFGLGWLAMGMGWMWQLTVPGYIAASIVFAVVHALAELAVPGDAGGGGWTSLVARPAAHTLVEALRFSFPFGGVPLATLGMSQVGGPLVGTVRVGGVILLTWVVLQAGAALGRLVRALAARRRPAAPVAGALVAVAGVVMLAALAPRGDGTGSELHVAAVQGGGEQGTRAIDVPNRLVTDRHLAATEGIPPDPDLDVVIWPENTVDTVDFAASEQLSLIAAQAQRLGVPIAVGVTEDIPGRPGVVYNAQIVVTPEGEQSSRYDKVRRVPFGEYTPLKGLLEALGAPVDQVPTNSLPGRRPAVVDLPDGTRFGVMISWEVFFGGRGREAVKHDATVLMNPTNGASYTGTIVQTQQVASSRLRAIETGRWLVQVAPTGFSAFVTPDGDVIDRTAVTERAVIEHTVELRTGRTWYVTLGDAPFIGAACAALAAAMIASARRNRPERSVPPCRTEEAAAIQLGRRPPDVSP